MIIFHVQLCLHSKLLDFQVPRFPKSGPWLGFGRARLGLSHLDQKCKFSIGNIGAAALAVAVAVAVAVAGQKTRYGQKFPGKNLKSGSSILTF